MLHPQGCAACPGKQWEMKLQYLNEGLTIGEVEDFYQQWRDNFITKDDIDYIASLGFNSVRVALHYELFLTPDQKAVRNNVITNMFAGHDLYKAALQTWYDDGSLFVDQNVEGFQVIDRLVDWCEDNGMYVILDMHAAPGAQGSDLNICDGFFANNLWKFPVFQDVLDQLWLSISNRYKSEPRIAMYELINEPNNVPGAGPAIHDLTQRLLATIRANDDNHLICIHGNAFGNFYDFLEPFTFFPNWGLVYSAHRYGIDLSDDFGGNGHPNQINRMVDMINFRATHSVPIYVGETGEYSNAWLMQNIANIESAGIGWSHWTYKRHDVFENPALMRIGGNYPPDGANVQNVVLNAIRFENSIPNPNTIAAVTSSLPPAGTSGCFANLNGACAPIGRKIWLECNTGQFVSTNNGQLPMTCSLANEQLLGRFEVVDSGNGKIALLGSNGRYVSSENGQQAITCNRTTVDAWERFDWVDFGDGTIGLRGNNGRYVSSENGTEGMTCTRDQNSAWESFAFNVLGDVNCDGVLNLLDVSPFVELLSNGQYSAKADFNSDGVVNLLDVAGFVAELSNN